MSKAMFAIAVLNTVCSALAVVGVIFVEWVTPKISAWNAGPPQLAAAHFGVITFGLFFIPVVGLCLLEGFIGWPALAVLGIIRAVMIPPKNRFVEDELAQLRERHYEATTRNGVRRP